MDQAFAVHILNDEGKQKAKEIAEAFDELLKKLSAHCFSGRELAIVKTKLEEASFFAKKSMALDLSNQLGQGA